MSAYARPNILIIITDQQRCDSLGCYGSNYVCTPCIDALAENGVRFGRAYCTNPICTPSRVSLFTGRQAGSHGAWSIGTVAEAPELFISTVLRKEGYNTGYIGKAHFSAWATAPENSAEGWYGNWEEKFANYQTPYYGFDNVELSIGHTSFGHHGHYGLWLRERLQGRKPEDLFKIPRSQLRYGAEPYDWEMPVDFHNSTWVADRTIHALRETLKSPEPFMIVAGFQDPHHPHCLPIELAQNIETGNIPAPHYKEGELDDKPPHFNQARDGIRQFPSKEKFRTQKDNPDAFRNVTEEDAKLAKAYYYAMVELIDRSVGRITEELRTLGLLENTIVVFTTDHGDLLGDHGLWRKGPFHYEQLVKVPLIIHWPAGFGRRGGIDCIVSHVDVAPTLLTAAGVKIPEDMDGFSLLPILKNERDTVRENAFIEYVDDPDELRLKTVVTGRYKLTVYHDRDYGELYDLEKDPWEIANLFFDPVMKDIKFNLALKILDEMEKPEKKLRVRKIASS